MEQRINGSTIRLIVFILILGVLSLFAGLYAEWLWFDSVRIFFQVFRRRTSIGFLLGITMGLSISDLYQIFYVKQLSKRI